MQIKLISPCLFNERCEVCLLTKEDISMLLQYNRVASTNIKTLQDGVSSHTCKGQPCPEWSACKYN